MSKKRTSDESNNDQQTNDGSDLAAFQPPDAKRARLASLSDTTLQDLPIELLECILVKVVAIEVKAMKLAKSVWKDKSGLVISRLRTVCSQWSSILATNFFRNELHRTLDRMAQETIRMEILHQFLLQQNVFKVTTLKDDIFTISLVLNIVVYDRNNMAEVKEVIPRSGIIPVDIAACKVSNCVYVLGIEQNAESASLSVLRITRNEEHKFSISPWISDLRVSFSVLSVSADGNLIMILSEGQAPTIAVLSIYNSNGSLSHTIMLSSGIYDLRRGANMFVKANGNVVLVSYNNRRKTHLTEVALSGSIVRQYQSTLDAYSAVSFADIYGRIVISESSNRIELLDSELNILSFTGVQLNGSQFRNSYILHYNSERNEVHAVTIHPQSFKGVLTIFRFTEE